MKRSEITKRTARYKKKLKLLHDSGAPKPKKGTKLYKVYVTFVYKSNDCFDEIFRASVPRWNKRRGKLADFMENRPIIKPHWKTKEGAVYQNAMRDPKLRRIIYTERPQWFAVSTKADILKLAREGGKKPAYHSKAWATVKDAIHPDSPEFDREFMADLFTARPDWFRFFKVLKPTKLKGVV